MPYPIYEEGLPIELSSPQVNRGWFAGINHDGFLGRRPASWAVQQGSNLGQPPFSRPAAPGPPTIASRRSNRNSARGVTYIAGLIYKELWHDPKTCDWSKRWSSDIGWLWVKLISFVEDHHSAGVVTTLQALTVATLNHIPPTAVNDLVTAKGLDVVTGGYRIHNYAKRGKLSRTRSAAGKKGYSAMVESLPGNLPDTVSSTDALAEQKNFASANTGVGVGVVERIFKVWSDDLGRIVRLTPGRRKVILARLKENYSEADLGDAAVGWRNDPWLDRPNQNDLTILFRDGQQVEKFRDLFRNGPPVAVAKNPALKAGRDWMQLADDLKAAGQ